MTMWAGRQSAYVLKTYPLILKYENPFQLDKSFHGLSLKKHFTKKTIAASNEGGLAGSMIAQEWNRAVYWKMITIMEQTEH
jgi:hypothetical protein